MAFNATVYALAAGSPLFFSSKMNLHFKSSISLFFFFQGNSVVIKPSEMTPASAQLIEVSPAFPFSFPFPPNPFFLGSGEPIS